MSSQFAAGNTPVATKDFQDLAVRAREEVFNRGFGWGDFQGMAQSDDYEGAGQWLQDLAQDRGMNIDRELEDMMIQYASDETVTAKELEEEFNLLTGI